MQTSSQTEALLLVHLSSLDAYTWDNGPTAGVQLAAAIIQAVDTWKGPFILVDQGWPLAGEQSRPREAVMQHISSRLTFTFPFDEARDKWDEAMPRLGTMLRQAGVTRLRCGGVWATLDGSSGCVNETARQLTRLGFDCSIDYTLCGLWS